jgi:heptosyltransferase-2
VLASPASPAASAKMIAETSSPPFPNSLFLHHPISHLTCMYLHTDFNKRAEILLKFNPYIDIICTHVIKLKNIYFDQIFSMDDELEVLRLVMNLKYRNITGAYLDENKKITYSEDSAKWFDMGIISKYGKATADLLKKENQSTHAEIFSGIFKCKIPTPEFWLDPSLNFLEEKKIEKVEVIGINPFAGNRWASKALTLLEYKTLIKVLLDQSKELNIDRKLVLFGQNEDRKKNEKIACSFGDQRVIVSNTDGSMMKLAKYIASTKILITSDSLAMHLAIAQNIPVVAFFAPTSAAEIDTFGKGIKVISESEDYCSYIVNVDNSSITAKRIIEAFNKIQISKNDY